MPIKRINLLQYVEKRRRQFSGKISHKLTALARHVLLALQNSKVTGNKLNQETELGRKGWRLPAPFWKRRGFYIDFIVQFHGKLISGH